MSLRPRAPIQLFGEDKANVIRAIDRIRNALEDKHKSILSVLSVPVPEFQDVLRHMVETRDALARGGEFEIETVGASIIAASLRYYLLIMSRDAEQRHGKTANSEVHNEIEAPVESLRRLCSRFDGMQSYPIPRLRDYVVLSVAEKLSAGLSGLTKPQGTLDEKFHILLSPQGFMSDLRYYRESCDVRNIPLCVAFIDIDDFKRFNVAHTEPKVDRTMLPRFMMALEAHVYPWGRAYRQGGDEYLVIIPNAHAKEASRRLAEFQAVLASIEYQDVDDDRVTVSIGVCEINPDSYLTEQQALDASARAKKHAKQEKGKGKIAYFADDHSALDQKASATIWCGSGEGNAA